MIRSLGFQRLPEPIGADLDEGLLNQDQDYLRQGHEGNIAALFRAGECYIPCLEENLGKDQMIIDICCGTGHFTGALAARFPNKVLGIDIDPRFVMAANDHYPDTSNLDFELMDAYDLGRAYPDRVGLITANLALHNFRDLNDALDQVYDSLQQGGAFFFIDVNPEQIMSRNYLQLMYMTRLQMGDDHFVENIVVPTKKAGNNGDVLDLANAVSILAAYTSKEIISAFKHAGFSRYRVDADSTGECLLGYGIK